jgi:hypothetical protein
MFGFVTDSFIYNYSYDNTGSYSHDKADVLKSTLDNDSLSLIIP